MANPEHLAAMLAAMKVLAMETDPVWTFTGYYETFELPARGSEP